MMRLPLISIETNPRHMRRLALFTLLVAAATAACAGESPVTTTIPMASSTTEPTTPGAITIHERLAFTDLLVLDVLEPAGDAPRPVAVLVHGGGWVGGERADMTDLAEYMAAQGFLVYNVPYRTMALGGVFPDPYLDIGCGVAFARSTARQFGGDPGAVTLIGYSAGAHLGAVVALAGDDFAGACTVTNESRQPDGFIGIAGPYDSDQFSPLLIPFFGGSRDDAVEAWSAGNPFSYLDHRVGMPIQLLHGTADNTVPLQFSQDFATALQEAGHDAILRVIRNAGHRDMVDPAAEASAIVEAVLDMTR